MSIISSVGRRCAVALLFLLALSAAQGEDSLGRVRKAVERCTLDQKGTHPFHVKATIAPSLARYNDSGRTGEVEIWWRAPGEFRRELGAPGFHQVQIVSGGRVWEKDDGDYFPDWLRRVAEALVRPLPLESSAAKGIAPDKERVLMGSLYLNWEKPLPANMQPQKQDVALNDGTGLFFYDGGLGWGALFKDYANFHGRDIARTVTSDSPEVMAKLVVLEDLPHVADGWFDATASGSDIPIRTIAVDNAPLADTVSGPVPVPVWPEVTNSRLTGVVWVDLVLDRSGHIREPFAPISDNPAINDAAKAYFSSFQFKPVLQEGVPVQVVRRIALAFELHQAK